VATDIAARGIDVAQVSHVINFDMPDTPHAYTHRIGRTGRSEREGKAYTFVTGDDHALVRQVERLMGAKLPRRQIGGAAASTPRSDASSAPPAGRKPRSRRSRRPRSRRASTRS
jgi:ATP-dependent RNA helicase RhlE